MSKKPHWLKEEINLKMQQIKHMEKLHGPLCYLTAEKREEWSFYNGAYFYHLYHDKKIKRLKKRNPKK